MRIVGIRNGVDGGNGIHTEKRSNGGERRNTVRRVGRLYWPTTWANHCLLCLLRDSVSPLLSSDLRDLRDLGAFHYSYRSARIGSMRLARRAGISPAATDTIVSSAMVATAILGS